LGGMSMRVLADESQTIPNTVSNGDFETGDLTGWTLLDGTPITNDNNDVGVLSNADTYWGSRNYYKQGTYFLSGAEKESLAGVIRSNSFVLGGDGYISFLMGAANTAGKGCVKIYKEAGTEDVLLRTYVNSLWLDPVTGNTLLRIYDKLDDYIGQKLYFVVENGSEPGFSFINVDDFRASMTSAQVQALYQEDVQRIRNISDEYATEICEMYRDVVFYDTEEKVGSELSSADVTVEEKLTGQLERYAGWTINLEEMIRSGTVIKDEFGIPVTFQVSVESVKYGETDVVSDWAVLALEPGTYTVQYTLSYESGDTTVNCHESFAINVTSYHATESIVNGDFETGDLSGWLLLDGTAATNDNNPVGNVSDDDRYWGSRYLYQQGRYALRGDGKEGLSGSIRSLPFLLGGDGYISFMIGTAASEGKGCVRIYQENGANDILIKTYTNPYWSDPKTGLTLLRVYDKLEDFYLGKELYFVVENGSEVGFSFISVDDFRTSLTRQQVIDLQEEQLSAIEDINDEYKDFIISCYRKNGIINDIVLEKEPQGELTCYAGVKVNLAQMIKKATKVIKSYSLEPIDVTIQINRVLFQGERLMDDFTEFMPEAGAYLVEYTRSYGTVTENKTVTVSAIAVDKSVSEIENGNFETGSLEGWQIINESAWNRDGLGEYAGVISANTYWGEQLPYNQEGNYHLNGWSVTDDESATWGVRSSAFTLAGSGWISVRMGGHAAELRVYQLDGTLVGAYSQNRFNDANFPFVGQGGSWADMGTYFVDLHEHIGESFYIELRDKAIAGGWAAAFFDDVKCYYQTVPDIAGGYDVVTAPIDRDENNELIYGAVKIPWTQLVYESDVLKLSFEEEGFEVVNDWGRQEHVALESNLKNPKYQDAPVEPYRPAGVFGKALNFDGYSNYVSFDEAVEGSSLTVDAYVCPRVFIWDNPGADREDHIAQVIAGSYDVQAKRGFLLGVTKHGYLAFRVGTGNQWYALASDDGMKLPTYQWSRVSAVFDGTEGYMTIYLNGEEAGTMSVEEDSEIVSAGTPILVGKGSQSVIVADNIFDGTMFCGLLDEITITMSALTAEEIAAGGMELPSISYEDAMAPDSALAGDYYRPQYHALPSGNWMNEPHALFQYQGKWHLFYQINPAGPYWHNISWGHWVSDDMVRWKFVKEAVIPTEGTIAPDGVWTGNVIFTADGKPLLLITAGDDSRPVNGSNQHVGLVRADDYSDPELTDWTIVGYAVAQTAEMGTAGEFRDAQAFGIGSTRYMVVGGADNGRGVAHVFKTTAKSLAEWETTCQNGALNGMEWEYKGDLFGEFFDTNVYKSEYGTVWEMPNLVPLPDENGNETGKYLFVFSPQGGDNDVWYYIGEFDEQNCRFIPDEPQAKLMDYGNNIFTGPTVYKNVSDGRVYICSVMQENVQDQEVVRPIAEHALAGWAFYAGLPRELYLQADGRTLGIKHIDTSSIEGEQLLTFKDLNAAQANELLKAVNSDSLKIDFEFKGSASELGFKLKKSQDSYSRLYLTDTVLGLDQAFGVYEKGNTVYGTIYIDKCSIEAYIDQAITISGSKYFRGGGLEVFIDGAATCSMTVTRMNSIHSPNQGATENKGQSDTSNGTTGERPADSPTAVNPEKQAENKAVPTTVSQPSFKEQKPVEAGHPKEKATFAKGLNSGQKRKIVAAVLGALRGLADVDWNVPDNNPKNKLKQILDTISLDELCVAMQQDKTVRTQIQKLEETYIQQHGISKKIQVDTVLENLIDANSVTAIGVGLNAEEGDSVSLQLSGVTTPVWVDEELYRNAVQIDIKLLVDDKALEKLEVPVTIQMPVLQGLDVERLVVLHYGNDGTYEVINPVVTDNKTMIFTVTHFSTFVFAESIASPRTEEVNHIILLVVALAIIMVLAGTYCKKREVFKK